MIKPGPFRVIALGLVAIVVDVRIGGDAFRPDLVPDTVGYLLIIRVSRQLTRSEPTFSMVTWTAGLLLVFGLRGQFFPSRSILTSDGFQQIAVSLPYLLVKVTEVAVTATGLFALTQGIGRLAERHPGSEGFAEGHSSVRREANAVRRVLVVTVLLAIALYGISFSSYFDSGLVPMVYLALGWLGFMFWSLLRLAAAADLASTLAPASDKKPSGVTVPAFVFAAAIAVVSTTITPPPSSQVGSEQLATAANIQAPGLADNPVEIPFNDPGEYWHYAPNCVPVPARLTALDVTTAEVRWRRAMPAVHPDSPFLDVGSGHLVVVDNRVNQFLPSVSLWDASTGEIQWRRFFFAEVIDVGQMADHRLAVHHLGPHGPTVTILELNGTVGESRPGLDEPDFLNQARSGNPDGLTASEWTLVTGLVTHDDIFNQLGNPTSVGPSWQATEDWLLVLVGSSRGPNSRLYLFDRGSGKEHWRFEPVRSGALADDRVVYDVRNDQPADAVSTRDLYVVDVDDPSKVEWTTKLSIGEGGGNGFVGAVGRDLVFAVADADTGVEFLTIADPSDVPPIIRAADGLGGGASHHAYVDHEVMAAATAEGVAIKWTSRPTRWIPFAQPVASVDRIGDLLLVSEQETEFCAD